MLVIAHRGASGHAPEHTFAAWDLALHMGADYLEQDLQMTRDGVLVVLHDETLDRTSAGTACGPVGTFDLADLADVDVGTWFNTAHPGRARPEYASQRVATLEQVLDRYADRASFYIETKQPESAPGMEEKLLALLERYGLVEPAAREWRVLVQSFSEASLRLLQRLEPRLPLIRLVEAGDRHVLDRLDTVAEYAVGIGPSWRDVDAGLVAAARAACLEVHPYTVNDAAAMERLAALGVGGMFTDVPDVLLGLRPAGEARGREALRAVAARNRACREASRP